jgi:hypothetical protein
MHNLLTILITVSFSRLAYLVSCSLKFVVKVSERRTEKVVVSNGLKILKQVNCYIISLEVSVLQIYASMCQYVPVLVTISVSNRCDLFYIFISYIFFHSTCFGPS